MFLTINPGIWNTNNPVFTGHLRAAEQIKSQSKMGKKPNRSFRQGLMGPYRLYLREVYPAESQKLTKSLELNTESCVKWLLKFLVKASCFTEAVYRCKFLFLV